MPYNMYYVKMKGAINSRHSINLFFCVCASVWSRIGQPPGNSLTVGRCWPGIEYHIHACLPGEVSPIPMWYSGVSVKCRARAEVVVACSAHAWRRDGKPRVFASIAV